MTTYKLQLIKVDPDGYEYLLTERVLTPEETIEHLADYLMQQPGITVAEEEEPEPEPVPEKKPTNGRAPRACGICGDTGHNKKTCPQATGDKDEGRYQPPGEQPWYYQDILDRLKDEESEESIYVAMHDRITDKQFQEALAWAKSEII